ncbi:hypothetical protein ACHAXA_003641 [Cyclostephanos tholiformis]|uniref:BPL/LPL catalytic domain-containing protein n=1 Tax=Cyclostephanos tholiformis TaxID=382380 RepID=A0ABD3SP75_9STRA
MVNLKEEKCCSRCFAIILVVLSTFIARGGGVRGRGVVAIIAASGGGGRIRVAAGNDGGDRGRGGIVVASSSLARMTMRPRKEDGGRGDHYSSSSSFFAYAAPTSSSYPPRRPSSAVRDATPSSYSTHQRPSSSSLSDDNTNEATGSSSCGVDEDVESSTSLSTPSWSYHPDDPEMWLYHVETTTSTMDEARRIVEGKFALHREHDDDVDNDGAPPATIPNTFLVSATAQTNGRGTSNRNWEGSRGGNALFTIGVPQSSWTDGLRTMNGGISVPLTLLPLKVGSLVAFHTRRAMRGCVPKVVRDDASKNMPGVTVKWPNDVLLRVDDGNDGPLSSSSSSSSSSGHCYEKIAGILVETSRDWFLIGIGINVGYAPHVPNEGDNRGRKATCLARYCRANDDETAVIVGVVEEGDVEDDEATATDRRRGVVEERHWIEESRKLATDIAYDLHFWLNSDAGQQHSGESILEDWKSYVDWDMELTLRDTPDRERVTLEGVLEDGRAVVKEVDTGRTRTLVSDYFL